MPDNSETIALRPTVIGGNRYPDNYQVIRRGLPIGRIIRGWALRVCRLSHHRRGIQNKGNRCQYRLAHRNLLVEPTCSNSPMRISASTKNGQNKTPSPRDTFGK
jgi:hypothetical protein